MSLLKLKQIRIHTFEELKNFKGSPLLYVVKEEGNQYVKVGCSTTIVDRLKALQADNARPLYLVGLFHGSTLDESAIHVAWGDLHVRGEFFRFDAIRIASIVKNPICLPLSLVYRALWTPFESMATVAVPKPLAEHLAALLADYEGETITTPELKQRLLTYTGKASQIDIKRTMLQLGWIHEPGRYLRRDYVKPMSRWGEIAW